MTGVNLVHVPYRGGSLAVADLKNKPNEVVDNLNREINVMVADPGMKRGFPRWEAKLVESDAE